LVAFVLCELARTDHHRFRVLEPDSDQTKALRALTRAREDLVHTRVGVSNQLRAELERFWPGPIGRFSDLDSQISLAFLEHYPGPADARRLGEKRLGAFLARQHYSGGQKPAQLLAKLRRAPQGMVGEIELSARRQLVLSLVAMRPAAQELAFTLKDGLTYVEQAIERGLDVDDFAPRLSFFFNAQIDFFEEIAKYRVARRIWARELRETFAAKTPRSWLMRFYTQTAGASLTAQQPLNNIIRTTVEALAGVLGGTQSLHTNSFDKALALPTEEAVRIALRTQQIIAHETGVTNTIDPLGGSYFVEALTDRLEELCYEYFAKIDELGGMVEAVKGGFPQSEIADAAFVLQNEIDAGRRIVVGVNAFTEGDDPQTPILRIDPAFERKQIERIRAARANRDAASVEKILGTIRSAAVRKVNLMPLLVDAARVHATEGEIVLALQDVWGDYREQPVF
jgi:Methylmalonyl-CoA mutase/Transposase